MRPYPPSPPRTLTRIPSLLTVAVVGLAQIGCSGADKVDTQADGPVDDPSLPLRPMVLLKHPNGQPSVVTYARGDYRVRDEHYNEAGTKIADVAYSNRGHHGTWKTYSAAGELQSSFHVIDGKKQGEEWRFDVDGNRVAIVPYKNGLREGVQFEFYPTGEKRSELKYKAGEPDGPMTTFFVTGERESVVNVVNERKHGLEVSYHQNGAMRAEVMFHSGLPDGMTTYYDEKGVKTASVRYVNGQPSGEETRYYPSGNVKMTVPIQDGERHGMAVLYTPDGKKQTEIPFAHGVVEGFDRRYSVTGMLRTSVKYHNNEPAGTILTFYLSHYLDAERHYTDVDKLNGKETRYYDAGPQDVTPVDAVPEAPVHSAKMSEVAIVGDERHGEAVFYERDGSLVARVPFEQGKRQGVETRYYPPRDGVSMKRMELHWSQDHMTGLAQTWWDNGHRQAEYPNADDGGTGIESRWNRNGQLYFKVPLVKGKKEGKAELLDPKTGALVATLTYADDVQDGEEIRYGNKRRPTMIYLWQKGHLVGAMNAKRKKIDIAHFLTPEELEQLSQTGALDDPQALIAKAKAWRAEKDEEHERTTLHAGALAIRAGTVETYFKDDPGRVQSKFPVNGNGQEVQYHKNGEARMVVPLSGGQRNGLARIYDETGSLWATVPFVHGSKHGVETRYAKTGEKIAEYPYKSDQPTGIARTWYTDGSKQSEYNFEPVGRGTEVQYHKNGEVRLHVTLVNGKRQGLATIYTETGVKWAEVPYLLGQKHGVEVRFDPEGHRTREITWRNGQQVSDVPVSK